MTNINRWIIKLGTIKKATKLPVITIGLGKVSDLKDVPGTIWHQEDGKVVIATKEAPDGCMYDQDRIAVCRIIGGKVLIGDLYDIYAPEPSKIEKLLSNPFELGELTSVQINDLRPILEAASEVRPSIAPPEYGRKAVVITEEMIGDQGFTYCHCSWDPEDKFTQMYLGDVFIVSDEDTYSGYRIGKEEFAGTHKFE